MNLGNSRHMGRDELKYWTSDQAQNEAANRNGASLSQHSQRPAILSFSRTTFPPYSQTPTILSVYRTTIPGSFLVNSKTLPARW